jgi:putative transposase
MHPDESPFRNGPIRTLADLEEITSAWVHWDNTSRLEHHSSSHTAQLLTQTRYARNSGCSIPREGMP